MREGRQVPLQQQGAEQERRDHRVEVEAGAERDEVMEQPARKRRREQQRKELCALAPAGDAARGDRIADAGSGSAASAPDSGNCEIGLPARGIMSHAASATASAYVTTIRIAAGEPMVVASGRMPVVASRKWPGVAAISTGVEDRPNCQTADAAKTVASRQGKSIVDAAFLRRAREMHGDQRPEREAEAPVHVAERSIQRDRDQHHLAAVPRQARELQHQRAEQRGPAENGGEHQQQRHLHAEGEQHPESAVERVGRRHRAVAEAERSDHQHDQQQHGHGRGVRHAIAGRLRESRQPVAQDQRAFRLAGIGGPDFGLNSR